MSARVGAGLAPAAPVRLKPATLIAILCVAGFLGGLFHLAERNAPESGKLDPGKYRALIEAVELQVYTAAPADYTNLGSINKSVSELAGAISEKEGIVAKPYLVELQALAMRADYGDAGYTLPDMRVIRSQWETTRAKLFDEADWFKTGSEALDVAQVRQPRQIDAPTLSRIERTVEKLQRMIDNGRGECESLGEPTWDPDYIDDRVVAHNEGWKDFSNDWEVELIDATNLLPEHPGYDVDSDLSLAYGAIERAIQELRMVPVASGDYATPFANQWSQRFDAANELLKEARLRLRKIPR